VYFQKVQKITAIAIASVSIAFTPQAARAAETFQVNGGYALNTNNSFRLIDGTPRMSLYQHNINDPDQQFDRLSGSTSNSILLRHGSTGKCLNAHYLSNNAEMNVWNCNASDPDQNWNLVNLPSGEFLIRRNGTNFCVDSPTRTNTGRIHLITCDANNANQRWKSTTTGSNQNRILQRAKAWVDARVPYNQLNTYDGYRMDCSGFISMAWELARPGFVTGDLPHTVVSSPDDLRPGDAINNKQWSNNGHVVMFVQWSGNWNQGKRKFIAYEENGGYGKTVQTTLTLEQSRNGWNIPEYPNHAPWYLQRKR
jgi:hypothetical protein